MTEQQEKLQKKQNRCKGFAITSCILGGIDVLFLLFLDQDFFYTAGSVAEAARWGNLAILPLLIGFWASQFLFIPAVIFGILALTPKVPKKTHVIVLAAIGLSFCCIAIKMFLMIFIS